MEGEMMRMFQEKSVRHFIMGILLVLFLSILLELGFLSDRTEAPQQLLLKHDQALASSLRMGVKVYLSCTYDRGVVY